MLMLSFPVVSNSLPPHGLQHARPPCPSPSPKVCPSSCPLSWWCHPTISSFDTLFSTCPQSFPASGTFSVSQQFTSDDKITGVSASASAFLRGIQGWFPLRLTGSVQGTLRRLFQHLSSMTSNVCFLAGKQSYDKPRQCAEKQRHYSTDKFPYSQGYGLPSGHIRLWELDHKEGRVTKNWCLWTEVLEKSPESPLDRTSQS